MDPDTAWTQFIDRLNAADLDEALDSLDALCEWLNLGGFHPRDCPFSPAGLHLIAESLRHFPDLT